VDFLRLYFDLGGFCDYGGWGVSDAIKQAIEALIECLSTLSDFGLESSDAYQQALAALQAMQGEADTKTYTNLCQKNAEPVAWMVTTERYGKPHTYPVQGEYKNVVNQCDYGYPIPLYTHPQPAVPDGYVPVPRAAVTEVLRISDRQHPAWDAVKAALLSAGKGE
jgi:hypothetical protein